MTLRLVPTGAAAEPAESLTFEAAQAELAARRHALRRSPDGSMSVTSMAFGLSRPLADMAEVEVFLRLLGWRRPT